MIEGKVNRFFYNHYISLPHNVTTKIYTFSNENNRFCEQIFSNTFVTLKIIIKYIDSREIITIFVNIF